MQLSFLDQLLLESEDYARELGERLKERVFEEVFPHLAEGFIVHIQQDRKADLSQETLDEIFQGTLTFLYRLLFLLYTEARNLLPVKEVRGYYEASLTRLKGEVAEVAGRIAEGVGEYFEKRFHEDSYELYDRLGRLFRVVAKGDPKLNVPIYNGGLFHVVLRTWMPLPLEGEEKFCLPQASKSCLSYTVPVRVGGMRWSSEELAMRFTRGAREYLAACGIGDLYRYFLQARRQARIGDGIPGLFNLLEEVVIRRTRPFIRRAYPEATMRYDLEAAYKGIYGEIFSGIENLKLAPYSLEAFKREEVEVDEFEAGREQALVGIFKSRYLKRFESSIEAFRISVHRALVFLKTFESYILDGRLLKSSDFHQALRYLASEDEEDDAMPKSLAEEMDASEEARHILETLEPIDTSRYDLRKLHEAVQHDVDILAEIWGRIKDIGPESDAKLLRFKELLATELRGKKVLIFSYFKDTARYPYRHLGHPDNEEAVRFCEELGKVVVRRMDSGADAKERERLVQGFAPKANDRPDWVGTDREVDILISTDVLSEGQNLQDCGLLINYDLHWNPTRMVQRAGRIDRIGTEWFVNKVCCYF